MSYKVEFQKELEEKDDTSYISRWSALITLNAFQSTDIQGFPVFYLAKEGALNKEDGYFTLSQNKDKTFHKALHHVSDTTYESVEIGSSTQIDANSMLGVAVDKDQAWQVDSLWRTNY